MMTIGTDPSPIIISSILGVREFGGVREFHFRGVREFGGVRDSF
jgi:hypothetical protein